MIQNKQIQAGLPCRPDAELAKKQRRIRKRPRPVNYSVDNTIGSSAPTLTEYIPAGTVAADNSYHVMRKITKAGRTAYRQPLTAGWAP